MINFFKNLFKKKETWVFASYQVAINDNKNGFGSVCKPISKINEIDAILIDIKEYIKQVLKENHGYENVNVVILYFKIWKW